MANHQTFGTDEGFPISLAVRAGDFVFTCAMGDHEFDPAAVTFDEHGNVLDDGGGHPEKPFEQEVVDTLGHVEAALAQAGCNLDDVVDVSVWLKDARDFRAMNEVFKCYFKKSCPCRSVFKIGFMFNCRIEIKVIAYGPLKAS